MTSHSPLPVGAIKTRVLILLIVLIIAGVAGTVIFTHLLKAERKPNEATITSLTQAPPTPSKRSIARSLGNTTSPMSPHQIYKVSR